MSVSTRICQRLLCAEEPHHTIFFQGPPVQEVEAEEGGPGPGSPRLLAAGLWKPTCFQQAHDGAAQPLAACWSSTSWCIGWQLWASAAQKQTVTDVAALAAVAWQAGFQQGVHSVTKGDDQHIGCCIEEQSQHEKEITARVLGKGST